MWRVKPVRVVDDITIMFGETQICNFKLSPRTFMSEKSFKEQVTSVETNWHASTITIGHLSVSSQ